MDPYRDGLRRALSFLSALLFPARCVSCGRVGAYVCAPCAAAAKATDVQRCGMCDRPAMDGVTHPGCRKRYGIDGLTAFVRYRGPVRSAVKAIKYRYASAVVRDAVGMVPTDILAGALATITDRVGNSPIVAVPVPLHPRRFRERGFNQAELLARAFTAPYGIRVATDLLVRVRDTGPQADIKDRDSRITNMRAAFAVTKAVRKDVAVLLVDDVVTTGATMRAAASSLKRAGAPFVWGIALAQG